MDQTCPKCGYQRVHCQCGRTDLNADDYYGKRNTSGDPIKFRYFTDLRNEEDFAVTSRINRRGEVQRRFIQEYLPINKEPLLVWYERTEIASDEVSKFAIQLHLFGTKKEWACHTTSRMCPICAPVQLLEITRTVIKATRHIFDLNTYRFVVQNTPEGPSISLESSPA